MAWSARLISIDRNRAMTYPTVLFSSDEPSVPSFEEVFQGDDIDPGKLATICKRRIMQLEARDVNFKKFVTGPIDVSKVVLPEAASPEVVKAP